MRSIVWGSVDDPVTQPYGPNHRGIDIGMAVGTALFAARAGEVAAVGFGYLCLTVGPSLRDWYLHVDRSLVGVGAQVARGDRIALSGVKQVPGGPAPTGPHLHFEVQTGALDNFATSLDPVPVLTGLYGGGGGELDVTPEQDQTIHAIQAIVGRIETLLTAVNAVTLVRIEDEIKALPAPAGQVDLSAVLAKLDAIKIPTEGKITLTL